MLVDDMKFERVLADTLSSLTIVGYKQTGESSFNLVISPEDRWADEGWPKQVRTPMHHVKASQILPDRNEKPTDIQSTLFSRPGL